jgi:hypothetical protein
MLNWILIVLAHWNQSMSRHVYTLKTHYPNSEPTSPCAISLLLCAWQRINKQDELWANAHLWYPPYMFNVYKNQLSRQTGIWRVQKRFPQYGIPIWSLWPNIRFLPSIVAEKNVLVRQTDRLTKVKQYTPLRWNRGKITIFGLTWPIYSTWGKHANHYTTNVVRRG